VKTAAALRHVPFEGLGCLEPVLTERGFAVSVLDVPTAGLGAFDPLAPDLLVVLGGPIGVYDTGDYPFLIEETRLIEKRLAAGRPLLGICLGCQLIARAAGARVYPSGAKEIGWAPVELTAEGKRSCLAPLADGPVPVLHWHGDTFDLPDGAVHLASTPVCAHQAFSLGEKTLALQFHLEATARDLEGWFVGHTAEISATPDISAAGLRAQTAACAETVAAPARRIFSEWLDGAGL